MTKFLSFLALIAASIFMHISRESITALPFIAPQRLGQTWSSMLMPTMPASSKYCTVWYTVTALP